MTDARRFRRPLGGVRVRVLLAFVFVLVFAAVVSTLLLRQVLLARAGERVDDALVQESRELFRLASDGRDPRTSRPFGDDVRGMFEVFMDRNVPGEREAVYTFVGDRFHLTTAPEPLAGAVRGQLARFTGIQRGTWDEIEAQGRRVRLLAVPVLADGTRGTFVVTADLAGEEAEVRQAVQVAAGVSLLSLVLAAVVGFLIAGRVLRPLDDVTATAQAISAEPDLTRRIPVEGDDELARLGRTFNAMLDRLEGAFASQRAFVSDAGHELRTPITIVRGHLDLLGDDPREREETMALVSDELDRMSRLVDDLITLAKSERTDFLRLEPLDLDVLTDELLAKARTLGERDWCLDAVAAGRLTADRQRVTQAMMNLAANAVQHTSPGDRIAIGSSLSSVRARLWIADSGPGVPPAEAGRVFERFARGSNAPRGEGSGLGLAITRAIAEAHGGRVDVSRSPGARFTLTLPIDPEMT